MEPKSTIHLYEVRMHGPTKFIGHCVCQWNSKPVGKYAEALKRARLHYESKRREEVAS